MQNLNHSCGEGGIRTRDTLLGYTHFPGARLRPLGHLSNVESSSISPLVLSMGEEIPSRLATILAHVEFSLNANN